MEALFWTLDIVAMVIVVFWSVRNESSADQYH
jgi:hypothetical protein